MFVFSGAFSQPGFLFFPADKIDKHVGRLWERMGVIRVSSWSRRQELGDFQDVGNTVAGTAGWRWTRWISHRILNYLTVGLASQMPCIIGRNLSSPWPCCGAARGRGREQGRACEAGQSGIEKYWVFSVFGGFKI